jgi:hypothetical protein
MVPTLVVVLLILMLVGSVPAWPYSRNWGFYPSSIVGVVLVIMIIMLMLGRL